MSKMKETDIKGGTGSWPNASTSDKICYDIIALKQMKEGPLSKNKPQTTSQLEAYDLMRKSPIPDYNFSLASIQRPKSDFLPTFVQDPFSKSANKDLRKDGKPSIFSGKSSMKIISPNTLSPLKSGTIRLSLREDVKLNQSENAWVPSRFKHEKCSKEEQKTQDLYKTFRGILNKLTPEKFEKLMEKIKTLEIDTQERLEGVIDLVFEKAIYEPKYSKAYALMCNRLTTLKVPAKNATSPEQFVLFRTLLISRCQSQFETKKVDENIVKLEDELSKCNDPAKKKELQSQLEEENRKVRMRSVGNVRFIGELYKLNMLTSKIMIFCLNHLVDKIQEEKLECLCKLLTTIGEQLENEAKEPLNVVFKKMQDIVDKKGAVSSRVRFMLEDVIALRRRRWVARSVLDLQPQTMEQIQREADMQQRHIEIMNATPQRRDGGGGAGGSGGRRRGDRRTPVPHHEPPRLSYSVDTNKLKAGVNKGQILSTTKLAPQNFGWVCGAGLRSPHTPATVAAPPPAPATLSNKYSLLTDSDDAPAPALPHTRDSSSRSQSNDDERPREAPRPEPAPEVSCNPRPVDEPVAAVSSVTDSSLQTKFEQKKSDLQCEDPFELKKARIKSTIDQFLITSDAEEVGEELRRLYPPQQHAALVAEILNAALEKSLKETVKIAQLILELVNTKTLSESSVEAGLRDIMEFASDIVIDVPKLYDYIACFVSAFIQNEIFSLATLYDMSSGVISAQQGRLLLKSVLRLLIMDKGEAFVSERWRGSGLTLRQWMNDEQVENFIVENSLHFLKCDKIKNEIPTSDSTDLDKNSNSTDKEHHIEMQTNNESACVVSDAAVSEPPSETHSNRIENAPSCESLNSVQNDRSLQIHNLIVNENASLNAVVKGTPDVDSDENLNVTEKCNSVRIGRNDNTSESVVRVKTEVESACGADNTKSVRNENIALSRDDNEVDSDVNSDENFNRLESCDFTCSINDNSARSDEKSLRELENIELGPSCSEDLNGIDNFSSESDAAEERNELCLEERLLAFMEAGECGERVLEWLELRKSRRPNDKAVVARALTQALCRYALAGSRHAPEDLFDEVRLQKFQDLLRSFDADRQHGLDCVIGVQDLMQRKPQHHEALLSILQYLLEENVVPLDALQAYEQFVNAQALD